MSSELSPFDAWLNEANLAFNDSDPEFWDPGFDGECRVVHSKLGPYQKLFLCPPKFIPRFYHRVYSLPIEDWHLAVRTDLYGGLCTIHATLTVHFQSTFRYVERNPDALPDVNAHIKASYGGLIRTSVDAELRNLREGYWIQNGLTEVERQIENVINEMLVLKQIKCRSMCTLKPSFEDLPDESKLDGRFIQESVYLNIVKKNFEFREKQNREFFRQEEQLEKERLQQLDQVNEIKKRKLALESENIKRLLKEQGKQSIEQYALEAELHAEKVKHQMRLQEIEKAAELQFQKEQQLRQLELERQMQVRQLELEKQMQEKRLEHEALMKEKELKVDYESQEAALLEKQKIEEQLEAARIAHQTRLREMQLLAEIKELELRVEVTKNKDQYLHRQIEWLVLDKQRAELTRAIKEAEQDVDDTFG